MVFHRYSMDSYMPCLGYPFGGVMIPTVYTHHVYIAPSRVPIWGSQDPKLGVQRGPIWGSQDPQIRGPNRGPDGGKTTLKKGPF